MGAALEKGQPLQLKVTVFSLSFFILLMHMAFFCLYCSIYIVSWDEVTSWDPQQIPFPTQQMSQTVVSFAKVHT